MPKISEALFNFLHARQTPGNADLVARWSIALETQVNVAAGDGEPVAGKRATWSNGVEEWFNLRIPRSANAEPNWTDFALKFPFDVHAEGIGCTGWDWQSRCSRWVGYDFDALTGHAKGIGISDADLERVKQAAANLPYVEVRRSTGGEGLHLYVYLEAVPTANHTEHAALARCVLGMMSGDTGFDFASQIDACGGVMWIWHRKLTAANRGLECLKAAEKALSIRDLPANWRDHLEVVTRRRAKIRIGGMSDDDLDPFEALASSRKTVPLDESHKAQMEALMRSGFTTLWVADHHLLQTHTCALAGLMEQQELSLVGVFKTISAGRHPETPNCFLFPLAHGGWRVYRFSQGIQEADTWTQDGNGWTTCYFNRTPDLKSACATAGGVENTEGGFVFSERESVAKVAAALGQPLDLSAIKEERKITLKSHKDGRLIVEIERKKGDDSLSGWDEKKNKSVKIFNVPAAPKQDDDAQQYEYDNLIRCLETSAREHAGWKTKKNGEWVGQPAGMVTKMLQNLGNAKSDAESIMGGAGWRAWRLVNLPFREEYPGGRQWNIDAAQFRYKPAELSDDEVPRHPHWDLILGHIGNELTPCLKDLPWAGEANIRSGGDYLRQWIACSFRNPFEPTPYLFLFGPENSGKSILHESLELLVTKGVMLADKALSSAGEFNGELEGAIICAVEEKDLSSSASAHTRIKNWVTGRHLAIRKMHHNTYTVPNTTHWIQTANKREACPVFAGDTRITMIYVSDLLPEQEIPKMILLAKLEEEAPHFLYTLLDLDLPPVRGRLRIPVITTGSKLHSEEINQSALDEFLSECCAAQENSAVLLSEFFSRFQDWLPAQERHAWTKNRIAKELPFHHKISTTNAGKKQIAGLALKPDEAQP